MKMTKTLLGCLSAAALFAGMLPAATMAADGEAVFKKCSACHGLEVGKHKVGPSLAGVVGRKAGTAEGYKRYKGLKDASWIWTEAELMAYLEDPTAYTKDKSGERSAMGFKLKDEGERKAVIEYLKKH
jgi:cytochrome c